MRLLKFFGAFVLTALILFGFVIGSNWDAFRTFFENRQGMMEGTEWVTKTGSLQGLSEFVGETPEYSSIASIVLTDPDSSLYYQADTPRIMGTTSNLFILIAYAREFDSGNRHPDQRIDWSEISEYQLPEVEESIHEEAYMAAQERGWIQNKQISLEQALSLLTEYGDLALSDYLWWNLDRTIWNELKDTLNVKTTDMPLPFSGLYQAIAPGLQQMDNQELIQHWVEQDTETWRTHVIDLSSSFINDSDFRNTVQNYLAEYRLGNTFMQERDAMVLFPRTTSREITEIMRKLVLGTLINERVSNHVLDFLDWPMTVQPRIGEDFERYGAIYDNRMGLLNGLDFGISAYTGDTSVQAFYLDQLPVGFWFHASGSQMHQDLMQRMIYDPAMIDQMYKVADKQND